MYIKRSRVKLDRPSNLLLYIINEYLKFHDSMPSESDYYIISRNLRNVTLIRGTYHTLTSIICPTDGVVDEIVDYARYMGNDERANMVRRLYKFLLPNDLKTRGRTRDQLRVMFEQLAVQYESESLRAELATLIEEVDMAYSPHKFIPLLNFRILYIVYHDLAKLLRSNFDQLVDFKFRRLNLMYKNQYINIMKCGMAFDVKGHMYNICNRIQLGLRSKIDPILLDCGLNVDDREYPPEDALLDYLTFMRFDFNRLHNPYRSAIDGEL